MNLYQIDEALKAVIDGVYIDEETGEVIGEDALKDMMAKKLEDYACYIKNLDADVKALKDEEKALAERRKAKEKKSQWLKKTLLAYMEANGKKKIETPRALISTRASKKLIIDDEDELISHLKETDDDALKVSYAVDKTVIKKDVEKYSEYAHIENNRNINIK